MYEILKFARLCSQSRCSGELRGAPLAIRLGNIQGLLKGVKWGPAVRQEFIERCEFKLICGLPYQVRLFSRTTGSHPEPKVRGTGANHLVDASPLIWYKV